MAQHHEVHEYTSRVDHIEVLWYLNTFTPDGGPSLTPTLTPSVTPTPSPSSGPSATPTPTPTPEDIANHLVVNEVYNDPDSTHRITGVGGENRGEWLEIYNPTSSDINVNGWTIEEASGGDETLSDITIPGHGFLILGGATEAELREVWSIPAGVLFFSASGGKIGNGLNNPGDLILLKTDTAELVDAVSWGSDTSVLDPAPPDVGTGHSLERDPDGKDADTAGDFVDRETPQPGQ